MDGIFSGFFNHFKYISLHLSSLILITCYYLFLRYQADIHFAVNLFTIHKLNPEYGSRGSQN